MPEGAAAGTMFKNCRNKAWSVTSWASNLRVCRRCWRRTSSLRCTVSSRCPARAYTTDMSASDTSTVSAKHFLQCTIAAAWAGHKWSHKCKCISPFSNTSHICCLDRLFLKCHKEEKSIPPFRSLPLFATET